MQTCTYVLDGSLDDRVREEMSSKARYEYNFVSEPDDALKCLICLDVARDPMQHGECGKLFCKECLEKHGKDRPCPNCKTQSEYYRDNKSKHD